MNKNQRGFSAVEMLVILVIVGFIGVAGFYVYSSRKDAASNRESNSSNQDAAEDEDKAATVKDGYKAYEDSNLSLQHPANWRSETKSDSPEWVYFKSPDYSQAEGELGPSVAAGYWLEVRVAKTEGDASYENDLKTAPEAQKAHGGSYETVKIDGHNAVLSDTKTHGTYMDARAYYKGNDYYFRLNAPDEDKPEVKALFLSILETVRLK